MAFDFNKVLQSKAFSGCIAGLVILIVLFLIFAAGMAVGFKKADFSYRFGDNYHKNFAGGCAEGGCFGCGAIKGDRQGMMGCADNGGFIDGHGVSGQIISVSAGSIVIKDRDNVEKIISVDDKTIVNKLRETIKIADLKAGDSVVIIGDPASDGKISAKLIRVMPGMFLGGQSKPAGCCGASSTTGSEVK